MGREVVVEGICLDLTWMQCLWGLRTLRRGQGRQNESIEGCPGHLCLSTATKRQKSLTVTLLTLRCGTAPYWMPFLLTSYPRYESEPHDVFGTFGEVYAAGETRWEAQSLDDRPLYGLGGT